MEDYQSLAPNTYARLGKEGLEDAQAFVRWLDESPDARDALARRLLGRYRQSSTSNQVTNLDVVLHEKIRELRDFFQTNFIDSALDELAERYNRLENIHEAPKDTALPSLIAAREIVLQPYLMEYWHTRYERLRGYLNAQHRGETVPLAADYDNVTANAIRTPHDLTAMLLFGGGHIEELDALKMHDLSAYPELDTLDGKTPTLLDEVRRSINALMQENNSLNGAKEQFKKAYSPANIGTLEKAPEPLKDAILKGELSYQQAVENTWEVAKAAESLRIARKVLAMLDAPEVNSTEEYKQIRRDKIADKSAAFRAIVKQSVGQFNPFCRPQWNLKAVGGAFDCRPHSILGYAISTGEEDITLELIQSATFSCKTYETETQLGTLAITTSTVPVIKALSEKMLVDFSRHDLLLKAVDTRSPEKVSAIIRLGADPTEATASKCAIFSEPIGSETTAHLILAFAKAGAIQLMQDDDGNVGIYFYNRITREMEYARTSIPEDDATPILSAYIEQANQLAEEVLQNTKAIHNNDTLSGATPASINSTDICRLFSVGRLEDVMQPEIWVGFEPELKTLRTQKTIKEHMPDHVAQHLEIDPRARIAALQTLPLAPKPLIHEWSSDIQSLDTAIHQVG